MHSFGQAQKNKEPTNEQAQQQLPIYHAELVDSIREIQNVFAISSQMMKIQNILFKTNVLDKHIKDMIRIKLWCTQKLFV